MDLSFLPAVNASLNGLATVMLVTGYLFIRRKQITAHRNCMMGAFGVSIVFLALYLLHKMWKASSGQAMHTSYNGEGFAKAAYLLILLTHLVLAMVVPVLAIWLIRLGLKRDDARHRRVARWALPIWLYVSVTGVVIYLMLYPFNPA